MSDPFSFSPSGGGGNPPTQFESQLKESLNRPASDSFTNYLVLCLACVAIPPLLGPFLPGFFAALPLGVTLYCARFQFSRAERLRTYAASALFFAALCFVAVGFPRGSAGEYPGVLPPWPPFGDAIVRARDFWNSLLPNPSQRWVPSGINPRHRLGIENLTWLDVRIYFWGTIFGAALVSAAAFGWERFKRKRGEIPPTAPWKRNLGAWPAWIMKPVSFPLLSFWGRLGFQVSGQPQGFLYLLPLLIMGAGLAGGGVLLVHVFRLFQFSPSTQPGYPWNWALSLAALPLLSGGFGFALGKRKLGREEFRAIFGVDPPDASDSGKVVPDTVGKGANFFLGLDSRGYPYELTGKNLAYHVEIVAPSGGGKTTLLKNLLADRVTKGHGVIFLDLKAEFDLTAWVYRVARSVGREGEFRLLSLAHPELSVPYNPIKYGSAEEIQSQLMESMRWDNEFYRDQADIALGAVARGLCDHRKKSGELFHLGHLHALFTEPGLMRAFADRLAENGLPSSSGLARLAERLDRPTEQKNFLGLIANLDRLVHSSAGPLMSEEVTRGSFDFREAVDQGRITYFLMNTLKLKGSADVLSKLVLQELMSLVGDRYSQIDRSRPLKPVTLVIDEFAHFASDPFIAFMDRARGAGVGIVLAHQAREDLANISPTFQLRVEKNSNTTLATGISPQDAEHYASMIGTQTTKKETVQVKDGWLLGEQETGVRSIREVEEYLLHPNQIKSLNQGRFLAISRVADPHWGVVQVPDAPDYAEPAHSTSDLVNELKQIKTLYQTGGERYLDLNSLLPAQVSPPRSKSKHQAEDRLPENGSRAAQSGAARSVSKPSKPKAREPGPGGAKTGRPDKPPEGEVWE